MNRRLSELEFFDLVEKNLELRLRRPENKAQFNAITFPAETALQIVAGPGSGKTTVLILRALWFVFVKGVAPDRILITTFTRRAARELRSRWLSWGMKIRAAAGAHDLDLNQCQIDTLDSIIHRVMTDFRTPGAVRPALATGVNGELSLKRYAFHATYRQNKTLLDKLLARYTRDREPPHNQSQALAVARSLMERLVQDRVDTDSYARAGDAESLVVRMLNDHRQRCAETGVFDHSTIAERFLELLERGDFAEWISKLRVALIDEYQDTNPLQEAIYFRLFDSPSLSATIVGDDDQAMYRFRGGSVELFSDFLARCQSATGRGVARVDMVRNFRSSPEIVKFFNLHLQADPAFAAARLQPPKALVEPTEPSHGIPVLGLFRDGEETLSRDLADLILDLKDGKAIPVDAMVKRSSYLNKVH